MFRVVDFRGFGFRGLIAHSFAFEFVPHGFVLFWHSSPLIIDRRMRL